MSAATKVRISLTVEIDAEAWAAEYGIEAAEVRADVKAHVGEMVRQQLDSLGVSA